MDVLDNDQKKDLKIALIVLMAAFFIGFFAGRASADQDCGVFGLKLKDGAELEYLNVCSISLREGRFGSKDKLLIEGADGRILAIFYFDDVSHYWRKS